MKDYRTVQKNSEVLTVVEKSKFISYCFPINTDEEAQEHLRIIRKKHYDASHNVWAYVLGDDMGVQRYSDDGEPSGTAGIPTLDVMRKMNVTDSLIIVTRYFGGTKLGAGGLVRAYSKSAKLAILEAGIIERKVHTLICIEVDYALVGKIQQEIKDKKIILKDTQYTEIVKFLIYVEPENSEEVEAYFVDITSDNCIIEILGDELLTIRLEDLNDGD